MCAHLDHFCWLGWSHVMFSVTHYAHDFANIIIMLMPMIYLLMMQLLLFTVIHVNFSQFAYSAEETDGEMTITLQADNISNWPYFVEINPTELLPIGAPGISSYILNCSWLP